MSRATKWETSVEPLPRDDCNALIKAREMAVSRTLETLPRWAMRLRSDLKERSAADNVLRISRIIVCVPRTRSLDMPIGIMMAVRSHVQHSPVVGIRVAIPDSARELKNMSARN